MARAKEVRKPEVKAEKPKEKSHFFPKLLMGFGLVLVVLAVLSFLGIYSLPKLVLDIILLLAGLWILKLSLERGFYRRRKEVLKKYI